MGMLLDAISGAGKGLADVATQQIDQQNKLQLQQQAADLDVQKAQRIAEFNYGLTNRAATQAGKYVQDALQSQIQDTAPPPTSISGNVPGSTSTGFKGNYSDMLNEVNRIKDPADKAAALAQLNQQFNSDQSTVQDALQGKTHAPSGMDAISIAMQNALADGNMQAYAALKSANSDQYVTIPDRGALLDKATGKIVYTNTAGDERAAAHDAAIENAAYIRSQGLFNGIAAREDARDARAQQQQMQINAREDVKSLTSQINSIGTSLPFIMDKQAKAAASQSLTDLWSQLMEARGRLRAFGGGDAVPPPAVSNPAPAPAPAGGMVKQPAAATPATTTAPAVTPPWKKY
jgi:hypothetical protein